MRFLWPMKELNTHIEAVEGSGVIKAASGELLYICSDVFTCWMRTSFSSFITFVNSSIWFDSCFVLTPKKGKVCLTETEVGIFMVGTLSNHSLFAWETLRGRLLSQKQSYLEFEQSLFVGNDSLVMKQHSQRSLPPPAWAHLNFPIEQKCTIILIWKYINPQHNHYCMVIL